MSISLSLGVLRTHLLRKRRFPRQRGGNRGRRGLASEQRPVLTAVSRGGPTRAEALPSTARAALTPAMSDWLVEGCIGVTDGHPSYQVASQNLNIHQEVVRFSRGEFRRGSWHLNTVNQASYDHEAIKPSPPWCLYTLPGPLHALADKIGNSKLKKTTGADFLDLTSRSIHN